MRTGVSYMGHHHPKHLAADLREMRDLKLDDVFLAAQENDFVHFPGTLKSMPRIAKDLGLRPIAVFWGVLNLFGGGRSSQFLLEHQEGFQVDLQGTRRAAGCYVNPSCVGRIQEMIDTVAGFGFEGYFVDEPSPLDCFCPSCRARFRDWYGKDLASAPVPEQEAFRGRCVVDYVRTISDYCKAHHPSLETSTCIMSCHRELWKAAGAIPSLDNLGTDIYWANSDRNVEEMVPLVRELDGICRATGKIHHEWLQCWDVRKGKEPRILEQGRILLGPAIPDALYVWAWQGQIGTIETCDDPDTAWRYACEVLAMAKHRKG